MDPTGDSPFSFVRAVSTPPLARVQAWKRMAQGSYALNNHAVLDYEYRTMTPLCLRLLQADRFVINFSTSKSMSLQEVSITPQILVIDDEAHLRELL